MEFLGVLFEVIVAAIDVFCMGADLHAWVKGKPNRHERKRAKKIGLEPPPRDKWNRRVLALTLIVGLLTALLLIRSQVK